MEKRKRKKCAKQTAPESFIPEMSGEQWEKDLNEFWQLTKTKEQ